MGPRPEVARSRRGGFERVGHLVGPRPKVARSRRGGFEGVAGGALLAVGLLVLVVGLGRGMGLVLPSTPALMLLGVIVVAASVVGDLTESLLKRWAGAKDSGQVLPGHGGILDRVDALLAGAPVMAIGVMVLEG